MTKIVTESLNPWPRIAVKRDCYNRLKQLANDAGKSMSGYLNEVSVILAQGKPPETLMKTPHQEVMDKLNEIDVKLEALHRSANPRMVLTPDGNIDPDKSTRGLPEIDEGSIAQTIKKGSDVQQVGFYDLGADGKWHVNLDRFHAEAAADDTPKTALDEK